MLEYTPLHVHTCFSGDGLGTVQDLLASAKGNGFKAIAMTDHGTLGGAVQFWSAAKENGIKPIFGLEAYMEWQGKRGHLTVLSRNQEGFNSLIALNNEAHQNKVKGFPVANMEMLAKHNAGLMVLTGCSASPIYYGSEADSLKFAGELYDIFGRDRLFAEVMGVIAEDNITRPKMIAQRFGLKVVITTDTHFVKASQARAHVIMSQCRKGYDYDSQELYLKTAQELFQTSYLKVESGAAIEEYMRNTMFVADMVEAIDLSSPPSLPKVDRSGENLYTLAKDVCVTSEENVRMDIELAVIDQLELYDYFAILYDIVKFCKSAGIKVGPGRGSGGGSFFLYKLGITDIDPLKHGLLFERFLSLSRKDMADFDLDVEAARRDEVIEYARAKWGALPIANYATYSNASLIRDLGRFFRVPREIVEEAADSEDTARFFAYCDNSHLAGFTGKDARIAYDAMLGQVRHKGKHAGGAVICTRPVPIEDGIVSWTEGGKGKELSMVGLVKYDILGVTSLSMLKDMETLTGVEANEPWDSDSEPVFDLFCAADLTGIFQFSGSDGIVRLTKMVQPRTLADLSAINALYRPGPLDSGMAWEYPNAKVNPRLLHPKVDNILAESYGVIIYQEQVMQIVALVTGGSLEEADNVRKIISKGKVGDPKWQSKMRELEAHFKKEGVKHFAAKLINTLWDEIVTFGRYGFNKSHSTAYSLLAYRMAWFKVYYPGAFYTALLNHDAEKVESWVYDAAQHGIDIVQPSINESGISWVWDKAAGVIFAPLSVIKWFGETGATALVEWRKTHGEFKNYEDVARVPKRTLNKRAKKLLYYAEGFRGLSGDPSVLIEDFVDLPVLSTVEAQRESIGFVIPSKKILDFMKGEGEKGRICGFVVDIEVRNKGKGDYFVAHLSPSGAFWSKDTAVGRLKEGDLVTVQMGKTGATDIKKARIK